MSASVDDDRSNRLVKHAGADALVVTIGVALVGCALAANQSWLDRHFLPSFFLPRDWYVAIETAIRALIALAGVGIALSVRTRAVRLIVKHWAGVLNIALAVVFALVASEIVLRDVHLQPSEWLVPDEEPRRQTDQELGWTLVPSRTGRSKISGRAIDYVFDAAGYRVRSADQPVDFERPTIIFTGESVMFGEGLTWDESIPAQVGATLGVQSANIAVHGYSTDQAYLRLKKEFPRFHAPRAVVSIFMTSLFGRNLDRDRPHLGPGLLWEPAVQQGGRLKSLATLLVPFRRDTTVERGIVITRDVLRATVDLARTRGAVALVIVPRFGSESPIDQMLRQRVLDEAGLPYERVELDSAWRLSWDRHPNAYAARVVATAIANRLHFIHR